MRRIDLVLLTLLTTPTLAACATFGPLGGKTVTDKQPPNRLVAGDGSVCLVSDRRFERTEVGMKVLCFWQGRVLQPPSAR